MTTDHHSEAVLLTEAISAIAVACSEGAHDLSKDTSASLWWGIHHLANEATAALDAEAEATSAEARGGFIHLDASQ